MKVNLKCSNKVQILENYTVNTGEPVKIIFSTTYDLSEGKIELKNGNLKKSFDFTPEFELPDQFLFEGRLCIRVEMRMSGKIVKHWEFAPIRIIEKDSGFEFQDEISELRAEIEQLNGRLVLLENKHKVIK